jgi:hypothetical protein
MTIFNFSNFNIRFSCIEDVHVKQLRQRRDTFIDLRIIMESMTLSPYSICIMLADMHPSDEAMVTIY